MPRKSRIDAAGALHETSLARTAYLRFVEEGATAGRRDDLVGGGLIRSSGGWTNVLAMRRDNLFRKSDVRDGIITTGHHKAVSG